MVNLANKYRDAAWLLKKGYPSQIYVFRNLETGQVLYSQLPYFSEKQIKKQFQRPNWQNRLPKLRQDIWRIMAVVRMKDHESAVAAYDGLVRLRHLREKSQKKLADSYRKKNEDGNIWFLNQYRPTWIQESVADILTVVDELKLETKIFWEELWRKGDDKYWNSDLVQHEQMERFNARDQSVILKKLAQLEGEEQPQIQSPDQKTEATETNQAV